MPGKRTARKRYAHRVWLEGLLTAQAQAAADDAVADPWLLGPTVAPVQLDSDQHTVDHLCWCRPCSNPDHTELVTRVENSRRRWQR